MNDIVEIIGYLWILPSFLLYFLVFLYRKLSIKKIISMETQTNKIENFQLTREYNKISLYIGTDSDLGKQDGYQIYINNQNANNYVTDFYPHSSLFVLEIPAKNLLQKNTLEVRHKNDFPLSLAITGDIKKVRQALIFILLSIIIIATIITIYYLSPFL